jgi:hypothetical protein
MQFGSDSKRIIPQAVNGILDDSGNVVVSGDTSFVASPLGSAARSQALYGIANANFNLTPNIPENPIVDGSNPLPFWSADDLSEGRITAKMFYNETDQTFAVELDPTAGSASDAFTLTTRSYLLNDSGISLRQKAYATLTKVNAYSSTNQWNLTLSATYYDAAGVSLSSFSIGTAADNVAFTGINGFTTSGTAIVSASAQYVDLAFTLTCALAVTSTVKVQIENILLQTSTGGGGGGTSSFVITETFTSSATWTRPTGVENVLSVLAVGAGGGGAGGGLKVVTTGVTNAEAYGGQGGGMASVAYVTNIPIGTVASISIGVGVGGAGGTAHQYIKTTGSGTFSQDYGGDGAAGASTTFGTYVTARGGSATSTVSLVRGGTASSVIFGGTFLNGTTLAAMTQIGGLPGSASPFVALGISILPTVVFAPDKGSTGGTAVSTGLGNGTAGTSVVTAGSGYFLGTGSRGGGAVAGASGFPGAGSAALYSGGTAGTGGGGSGGGGASRGNGSGGTFTVTGGVGGAAAVNSGAGGGGGGAAVFNVNGTTSYNSSVGTGKSGTGGAGGDGYLVITYVG